MLGEFGIVPVSGCQARSDSQFIEEAIIRTQPQSLAMAIHSPHLIKAGFMAQPQVAVRIQPL
jgi:hypothetical protein